MRTFSAALLTVALALSALVASVSAEELKAPPPPAYRVIVHPQNPVSRVDKRFLQDAFLKKARHWPHDKVIHPVDLISTSKVRRGFSEGVLNRSIAAVKAYWQQRIFAGRDVPPPEFDSDEKVVSYVLKYEGSVGYVSGMVDLLGAKVVSVSH